MNHKLDSNKILNHIPGKLEAALNSWKHSAQKRLVYLLADMPGKVTHEIMPVIGTNNMAATAEAATRKLKPLGYEIVCISVNGKPQKSWQWFLCRL